MSNEIDIGHIKQIFEISNTQKIIKQSNSVRITDIKLKLVIANIIISIGKQLQLHPI